MEERASNGLNKPRTTMQNFNTIHDIDHTPADIPTERPVFMEITTS